MPRRNKWKFGDWLVKDEESGITRYASEIKVDYRGQFVTKRYADYEHPQDFISALNDPQPVPFTNTRSTEFEVCNTRDLTIGETGIPAPGNGPADHLFGPKGIGEAEIGCDFIVS